MPFSKISSNISLTWKQRFLLSYSESIRTKSDADTGLPSMIKRCGLFHLISLADSDRDPVYPCTMNIYCPAIAGCFAHPALHTVSFFDRDRLTALYSKYVLRATLRTPLTSDTPFLIDCNVISDQRNRTFIILYMVFVWNVFYKLLFYKLLFCGIRRYKSSLYSG